MRFPAGLDGAIIQSHGCKLLGGFYRAAGDSPRPTALLLHGVPGVEKNMDIAYALRDAGWNCLYFHYRGSWGSEGEYSFHHLIDDSRAATDWICAQPSADQDRLAIVGMSMGGWTAGMVFSSDTRLRTAVLLSPLSDPTATRLAPELAAEFVLSLQGTSVEKMVAEWDELHSLASVADRLKGRPFLLITAGQDELFPPDHYNSLLAAFPTLDHRRFPHADHVFSRQRRELVQTVVSWLVEALP